MQNTPQTSADDVIEILKNLDCARIGDLFSKNALTGLHQPMVEALKTKAWLSSRHYDERVVFLSHLKRYTHASDNYRQLFMAMAESGHRQGTLAMIKATGRKDKVLAGNQALITMGTLTGIVKYDKSLVAPVVHYLTRAAVSALPGETEGLFKALTKGFDPIHPQAGYWLEAIYNLVKSRDFVSIGLTGADAQPATWINKLVSSEDKATVKISGAVVAALMAKGSIRLNQLQQIPFSPDHKLRLVKELGLEPEDLKLLKIVSSRSRTVEPSYRL